MSEVKKVKALREDFENECSAYGYDEEDVAHILQIIAVFTPGLELVDDEKELLDDYKGIEDCCN